MPSLPINHLTPLGQRVSLKAFHILEHLTVVKPSDIIIRATSSDLKLTEDKFMISLWVYFCAWLCFFFLPIAVINFSGSGSVLRTGITLVSETEAASKLPVRGGVSFFLAWNMLHISE